MEQLGAESGEDEHVQMWLKVRNLEEHMNMGWGFYYEFKGVGGAVRNKSSRKVLVRGGKWREDEEKMLIETFNRSLKEGFSCKEGRGNQVSDSEEIVISDSGLVNF